MSLTKSMNSEIKDWYISQFLGEMQSLNGKKNNPINLFRQEGFEEFSREEFPTRRDEDWKYTNVKPILKKKFKRAEASQETISKIDSYSFNPENEITISCINGKIDLSNVKQVDGLTIESIETALEDKALSSIVDRQLGMKGGTDKNIFLPLNRAMASNGILIKVDKNTAIEKSIHIVNITTKDIEDHAVYPQLFIQADQGSDITVIESYNGDNQVNYFVNAATYVVVEKNASVSHYRIQNEGSDAYHINNILVNQDRDSVFTAYAVDLGSKMVRNNMSTEHLDSNVETNYYCAYIGNNDQHIDNQTFIDHAVPHCESNELYKGILTDTARGVFNGKVLVRQDAQKTNAFQQNSSLVLTDKAVMDSKPQLEIYADDVKCSHGATIGQLDEASIFYLNSRGIPKKEAENLLQKAFVGEVLLNFKDAAIRERILELVDKKLGN